MISEALEHFILIDQFDAFNSAGIETLVRTAQYIEYDIKRKRELKLPADNARFFRTRTRQLGGCVIDPALLTWISSSAGSEAKILAGQRQANEEAALAAANRKKKGGE